MCIICYKPAGVQLPPRQILENCFENNPDGAGFMVKTDAGIRIRKGYFSFTGLYNALTAQDLTPYDVGVHCRITTHGATCKKNCHPFAIANKLKTIRKTNTTTAAAVMHNGILSAVNVPAGSTLSDTVLFTRDVLSKLRNLNGGGLTDSNNAAKIIDTLRGSSRLLIFDKAGVKMFGNFTKENGIYYSNDSYSYNLKFNAFEPFNVFNKNDENADYLDDYSPSNMLKYKACEACPYYYDCLEHGEYCLSADEAEQAANDYKEQGVLYGI